MSQPPSPSSTPYLSPLEAQDGSLQHSAVSDSARQERLAALERRLSPPHSHAQAAAAPPQDPQPFDANHAKRIEFRRLVDPGIVRPNSKDVALRSLRTLSTIAENLLREPDNPKFRQFKPTNTIIKRDLVDPKGALEYAVAMGFRPEVLYYQSYYTFNNKYMMELHVGAAILREGIQAAEKGDDQGLKLKMAKAEQETRIKRAKEAIMDDRKTQILRAERERQLRHQTEHNRAQSPTGTAQANVGSSL